MDVFSEIEGLSGENLGSALLRYLIFNSHEVRNSILSLFSDKSPIGPISYTSHFACRTEYPTAHTQYGNGRLDILIQLDDVVIGIENKFFSQFQDHQPHKYYETLETVAGSLKSINHTEVRTILYVLCPEARKKEALEKINGLKDTIVISWEEVLAHLERIEEISNPVAKIVLSEFINYLKRHFSFVHDFERKAIHLKKSFPDYGSPLQGELIGKLWSLFPSAGGRLSNGETWLGYYFFTDPEINEKGWFGFVPKQEIEYETDNQAELIVATTYKPSLSDDFAAVKMIEANFIGSPGKTNAWVIKFDENWNNVEKWRQELLPFWSAVHDDIT